MLSNSHYGPNRTPGEGTRPKPRLFYEECSPGAVTGRGLKAHNENLCSMLDIDGHGP
jgi:hypothetical protein